MVGFPIVGISKILAPPYSWSEIPGEKACMRSSVEGVRVVDGFLAISGINAPALEGIVVVGLADGLPAVTVGVFDAQLCAPWLLAASGL